jgi:hypothetical protein
MLSGAEDAVETLVAERVPFDEIEEYIDQLPLDGEHRSALWLLAWAQTTNLAPAPPRERRNVGLAD